MRKLFKDIFLNEKLILLIIVLNAVVLFLQESGYNYPLLTVLDLTCTFIFIIEMIVKHAVLGFRQYWASGWNRLDGVLVILSLPSLVVAIWPEIALDLSFLMVLRVLRVFRFFRLVHAFPGFVQIMKNFKTAMRQSYAIFLGLLLMIIIFAMIGCSLLRDAAPEYFNSPLDAIYTTFRIFTGEGWNDIPDTVALSMGGAWGHVVRLYFCAVLLLGCIIGMSLLNSIFVDAMVSDNNEDISNRLTNIEEQLKEINSRLTDKE
jgi:voltage-gated sodium channel